MFERGEALGLDRPRRGDAGANLGTSLRCRRQHEVGGGDSGNFDLQIDAVEQRAGDARLVALDATAPHAAGIAWLAGAAAAAGIHRGDELNAGWVGDAVIGPRDHGLAGLERLAQRIEHLRVELRQLVEKQHAEMGKCRFARARARAAADQRRHARRVMRRAEGARPADAPAGKIAGEAPDHAHFQHLGRRERREEGGQPLRQHRLAGAGRPDHQEIMPAGGRHFERALRRLLALDVAKIGHGLTPGSGVGSGRFSVWRPLK